MRGGIFVIDQTGVITDGVDVDAWHVAHVPKGRDSSGCSSKETMAGYSIDITDCIRAQHGHGIRECHQT